MRRVFNSTQRTVRENEEKKVRDALGKNYNDSLNMLSFYKATEAKKFDGFVEATIDEKNNEIQDYFWYITEGRNERPIWVNSADRREKPPHPDAVIQALPTQFVKNLVPPRKGGDFAVDKLSVLMISQDKNDIPQLTSQNDPKQFKSFKVPTYFKVSEIVDFLWTQAKLSDYFLVTNKEKADANNYLMLNLQSKIVESGGELELIPLDP